MKSTIYTSWTLTFEMSWNDTFLFRQRTGKVFASSNISLLHLLPLITQREITSPSAGWISSMQLCLPVVLYGSAKGTLSWSAFLFGPKASSCKNLDFAPDSYDRRSASGEGKCSLTRADAEESNWTFRDAMRSLGPGTEKCSMCV